VNERPTDPDRQPTDQELPPADHPNALYGYVLGALVGLVMAVLYAVAAEALGLTFGLLAVGFFGGWAIGGAVGYGAWSGRGHVQVRSLQVGAAVIAALAWLVGLFLAYVVSQALLPEATTPLFERVTLSGFAAYFGGTFDFVRLIHLVSLIAAASMAWRGAR
jgi:hypothetical protein